MKLLGFWNEYRDRFGNKSLVEENFNDNPYQNIDRILDYLSKGFPLGGLRTMGEDLKDGEHIGPLISYTDGEWFWTTEYMFYIKKYHLKIDPEFLVYLNKLDFTPSSRIEFSREKARDLSIFLSDELRNS